MPAFIYTEQIMIIVAKRTLKHMKETKLKRLIKKMMDCVFLDAMTPEFKAANAELLKAIKMNDKSGAVPHADLEAVNKAMKENDADKAGAALKKVQLQFSKAEKKLDDDVKSIQAKLETTKKAAETAKASLKQKKALASVFDKLKALVSGLSNNPKNASKLTALTDKVKDYGDLSKRASQIITLVSSNKDASKQIDMLKKSVDAAEKKYKKDLANAEKESKKADDALEVAKMQVKITQGKKDAFTKERLYIANVVKQMPQGDLRQKEGPETKANNEFDKALQDGKRLYESLEKAKSNLKGLYESETKFMSDLRKRTQTLDKSALKNMLSAAKKVKNKFLAHDLLSICEEFANDKYSVIQNELQRLKIDFSEYADHTKSKEEKKAYKEASDACKNMLDIHNKWLSDNDLLAKDYKEASKMKTRPDLDPVSRIRLFNKIKNENTGSYELQIVELLHNFGQPSVTKPAKNFDEFKKWMMIGAERIKNDIV